jgi:hypothetical protein
MLVLQTIAQVFIFYFIQARKNIWSADVMQHVIYTAHLIQLRGTRNELIIK